MDWKKAKNYTIVFLLILNALLLGCNMYIRSQTAVDTERVRSITTLAAKRGITLSATLPRQYPAMRELEASEYSYDQLKLQRLFFSSLTGISRTDKGESIIFTNGSATLKLTGSLIEYENENAKALEGEEALQNAKEFASEITKLFGNYKYYSDISDSEKTVVTYYDTVNHYPVFTSFIRCIYYKKGGRRIEVNYASLTPAEHSTADILASDEAVYALVQSGLIPRGTAISDICQGYCITASGAPSPAYLITAGGKDHTVNALTGECEIAE